MADIKKIIKRRKRRLRRNLPARTERGELAPAHETSLVVSDDDDQESRKVSSIRSFSAAQRWMASKPARWWETAGTWIGAHLSFWKFLIVVAVASSFYFYLIAEPLYVSEAIVSLKDQSSSLSGVGALLASGALGSTGNPSDVTSLLDHIESPEMLRILDKKFHLREYYSSSDRWPWSRLWSSSDENFLAFYQSMIEIDNEATANILDIRVIDYTPQRSQQISAAIIDESENFMNKLNDKIQVETMRSAKAELANAMVAVATAQPWQQQAAEVRLSAAQTSLQQAQLVASQQMVFMIRVSNSTLPTESDRPERFLDVLASILIAGALYVVCYLLWQNVIDHRRS